MTIRCFLVVGCAKSAPALNSEQANKIAVSQIKIASFAQPRKHSVATRPFSTLKYNTIIFSEDVSNVEKYLTKGHIYIFSCMLE